MGSQDMMRVGRGGGGGGAVLPPKPDEPRKCCLHMAEKKFKN